MHFLVEFDAETGIVRAIHRFDSHEAALAACAAHLSEPPRYHWLGPSLFEVLDETQWKQCLGRAGKRFYPGSHVQRPAPRGIPGRPRALL
jgi:hypothetical protein